MKSKILLIILVLLGHCIPAKAENLPSFDLEDSAWNATDIIVVTASDKIDGNCQVLETWKGGLKAGEHLFMPELKEFAPQSERKVSTSMWRRNNTVPDHVSGTKIVLFLKHLPGTEHPWQPANVFNRMNVAVAWIEGDKTFSFIQESNPGPSQLTDLGVSAENLKADVLKIVQGQRALLTASSLKDPAQRAQLLRPFVNSRSYAGRRAALAAFVTNGKESVPVLREMLNDQTLRPFQGEIVEAFGQAGGSSVGGELTSLLEKETDFWRQRAPALQTGWWNGTGLEWPEVELLRDHYSTLLSTLYAIKQVGYKGSHDAVVKLRDYWISLPQLEDKSGLNQMSETCSVVLQSLNGESSQ